MQVPENELILRSISQMGRLSDGEEQSLKKLFHVTYFIGSKERPYTDFTDRIKLEKMHGVQFFRASVYENETAARDFINFRFTSNVPD